MSSWNEALAQAISAIGQPEFAPRLEGALSRLMPFRICMVFAYSGHARPETLYHNMPAATAQVVMEDYSAGPYLLDPFYSEVQSGRCEGMYHLRGLAPDSFFKSEYYLKHYRRTGIRDELGIPAPLQGGGTAVLSLARTLDSPSFSRVEHRRLAEVAPVVAALMAAHWQSSAAPVPKPGHAAPQLDAVLRRLAGDLLTAREVEVIGMVLKGYSAAAIAAALEISEGTVKVHRKNSYRKLGISSQAELFSRFIAIA